MSQTLGRYVLERRLASGGMAEIFLARQSGPEGFEKLCVVKRMLAELSEDETFVGMFLDEARLAAKLSHPNIAQLFDFGRHEDTYYLALEHVSGANLQLCIEHQRQQGKHMPLPVVLRITSLVAQALDYAHRLTDEQGAPLNLIHRDVSPHNVMVSESGDVKLIDFGIAKAATATNNTKAGTLKGKYAYMAPEHIRGLPIDKRIDIYSLGLVLFEMLAGRPAIQGESEMALMRAAAKREFPPIESFRSDLPPVVRAALERALALEPADRFQNAGELADALEDYLTQLSLRVKPAQLALMVPIATATTAIGKEPLRLATPSFGPQTHVDVDANTYVRGSDATLPGVSSSTLPDEELLLAAPPVARPAEQKTSPGEPRAGRAPAWPALAGALALIAGGLGLWQWSTRPTEPRPVLVPPPRTAEAAPPAIEPVKPAPVTPVTPAAPVAPAAPAAAPTEPRVVKSPPRAKPARAAASPAGPKAGRKGTVIFRVLPWGEVFLLGKSLGVTPLQPLALEAGVHSFKVVNPDTNKSQLVTLTVTAGAQSALKVDLR